MRSLLDVEWCHIDCTVRCTVSRASAEEPLAVYRFLRDELHAERMQFIPRVEKVPIEGVSERSVRPGQMGTFLMTVFDEWVRHDVGTVFVETFETTQPGLDYLRGDYAAFFRHIDRPMRMISRLVQRGIPAAVVMKLLAKEDALRPNVEHHP